jgi:membrane protein implicated in regulation of membrane protease activity
MMFWLKKATVIIGVIVLMLISIWALGFLGPILVSLVLELLAWWIERRNKQK